MSRLFPVLGLLLLAHQGYAHEVHATTRVESLTVVTLAYANGKPFAYEQFEVTPAGTETPSQVGRTDAQGRAAVLPVPGKDREFTAAAKDGHGAKLSLAAALPAASDTPATAAEAPRWLLIAAGGGILFGLFGLLQLFAARKRRTDA